IADVQITLTGRSGMTSDQAQNLLNAQARGAIGIPPELLQSAQETARSGQASLTAVSDRAGQFSIKNVPAGIQNVRAQLEGYFGPAVNGTNPAFVTVPVTVAAQQTSDVRLSLLP